MRSELVGDEVSAGAATKTASCGAQISREFQKTWLEPVSIAAAKSSNTFRQTYDMEVEKKFSFLMKSAECSAITNVQNGSSLRTNNLMSDLANFHLRPRTARQMMR